MARALFVSVNETFPQLSLPGQQQYAAALRNCTCVAWEVAAATQGIQYLFGVVRGQVKSAYRVTHPNVADWPTIPPGALGGGFRCVPVVDVDTAEWTTATGWAGIPMAGRILYGTVQVDAAGRLVGTPAFP